MFQKEKKEKTKPRFMVKEQQALGLGQLMVIVDTKTGVNYLAIGGSSLDHITPLLDREGNVVIDPITL